MTDVHLSMQWSTTLRWVLSTGSVLRCNMTDKVRLCARTCEFIQIASGIDGLTSRTGHSISEQCGVKFYVQPRKHFMHNYPGKYSMDKGHQHADMALCIINTD